MTNEMPQTPEAVALRLYQIIVSQEGNPAGPRGRQYHLSTYAECLNTVKGGYPLSSSSHIEGMTAQTIAAARQLAGARQA